MKNNIQINRDALFSAETEDYRMPAEPDIHDKVVVRMRTAKDDVDHVYYIEGKKETEMKKTVSDTLFDYYEHTMTAGEEQILYHFKIVKGTEVCQYNRLGVSDHTWFSHSGLGKRCRDVPDLCRPLLQWRSDQ